MSYDQAFFLGIALFGALFLLVSFVIGEVGDAFDSVGGTLGGLLESGDGAINSGGLDGHSDGPSPLSVRNLMAFLTAYGASGLITSALGWSTIASSLFAILPGIALGTVAYKLMRALYDQQSSSVLEMGSLVGYNGVVDLTVPATGLGRVTVHTGTGQSTFLARSEVGESIPTGTLVIIKGNLGSDLIVAQAQDSSKE